MTSLQSALSYRKLWRDVSTSASVAAATDHSASFLRLITCLPGYSIFVQKATFSVITESNTESTLQSSNATPVKIAEINNPSSEGPFPFDFDEAGVQLAEGEHLEYRNSAAGTALLIFAQAYMKPTAASLVAKTAGAAAGTYQTTL